MIDMGDNLIEVLGEWKPPEEWSAHPWETPTREGLGRELKQAVMSKPDYFADMAEKFKGLNPTYVRNYVEAFRDLIQNNSNLEVEWSGIIDLCSWIMKQEREIHGREDTAWGEQDPHWGWARISVVMLVTYGLTGNMVPCKLKKSIWEIIALAMQDPDPEYDEEDRRMEGLGDPYTLAINSVRGSALETVIEYALWILRHHTKKNPDNKTFNLDNIPEVRTVLNKHLDDDRSVAIRSVYGRFFPWLLFIDKKWVSERLDAIFPPGRFNNQHYMAAWDALMRYCPVYDDVFTILKERYAEAIKHIGDIEDAERDRRLAMHLMNQYTHGKIGLSDSLLNSFWEYAPSKIRGHALHSVGQSLAREGDSEDDSPERKESIDKFTDRCKSLWESRWKIIESSADKNPYKEEAAAFDQWFGSGLFNDKWSLQQYLQALEVFDKEPYGIAMEQLQRTIKTEPTLTMELLSKIVLGNRSEWFVSLYHQPIVEILSAALDSEKDDARDRAENLISQLAARGNTSFHDIFKDRT